MRLELRPARRGDALQDQHAVHPGDGSQRYPYDHVVDADTLAHTDEDIRQTADAAEGAFKVIERALEGELDELLEVDPKREPFRRFVR